MLNALSKTQTQGTDMQLRGAITIINTVLSPVTAQDDPESKGWTRVSEPAFARDWNSEEDREYDQGE